MMNPDDKDISSACCSDEIKPGEMISHCPMAAKFQETLGNTRFIQALWLIGIAFLLLGVAIFIEPVIIAWLVAIVVILLGFTLIFLAFNLSKLKSPATEK